MKFLAFTDAHADSASMRKISEKTGRVDLVVCCGDFTVFGDGMKKMIESMDSLGKKVLLVHGNHEDEELVEKACRKSKHLNFIHKGFHEHDGVIFCGYGGGGFAQRDIHFEIFCKQIDRHMSLPRNKGKPLVMVFHMPPYGVQQDSLPMGHVGSESYTEFIRRHKPVLALCGHIEENSGTQDKIGKTVIINPGPSGKVIEIGRKQ